VTEFVAPPVRPWRRVAGGVALPLALLALVVTVVGVWNPWSLVVLHAYAGDPVRDVFVTLLLFLVGYWLLRPVTSEAAQHGRVVARAWLVAITVFAGLGALLTWGLAAFRYQPDVIARSPDGTRAVALVTLLHERQLHAFRGTGLGTRDMGSFGVPCGPDVTARFTGPDQVRVETAYGTFDLRMNPDTGRPANFIGPTCSG
jgi:hypothetical protein